jgi:uncharacterized repeat protein (TIGR02543 family)
MLKICYTENANGARTNRAGALKTVSIIMVLTLVFSLAPLTIGTPDAYGAAKAKEKVKTQQDKVISFAMSNLGKRAGAFGFGGGGWCTKYVNLSMKKTGLANGTNYPKSGLGASREFATYFAKKGSYTSLYKKSSGNVGYKTKVDYNYVPKKGDIAIFARSKGSRINHVGLVSSVVLDKKGNPKYIRVVHGNWSSKVSYTTFNAHGRTWGSEIVGYSTPNYSQTVTLNANGGKVSKASVTALKAHKYGKLPTPKRDGYKFAGWYTAKNDGKRVKASTRVKATASHTLYARWKEIKKPVEENPPVSGDNAVTDEDTPGDGNTAEDSIPVTDGDQAADDQSNEESGSHTEEASA